MIPILYDKQEKDFTTLGLGVLADAIDCIVREERNGIFELVMQYPKDTALFNLLKDENQIVADASPELKEQIFIIDRVTKPENGVATIYASHISQYKTVNDVIVNDTAYNGNAQAALEAWNNGLVSGRRFEVSSNIGFESSGVWNINSVENARKALGGTAGSILDIYGGEYRFDNNKIQLLKQRGRDSKVLIAYGKNITNFIQDEVITNTVTSIYPFATVNENTADGDTDTKILELPEKVLHSENASKFAHTKVKSVDLSGEGVTDEDTLRSRALTFMKANNIGVPDLNLSVSFVDLAKSLNYSEQALSEIVNLCDLVYIDIEDYDIWHEKAKITTVIYNVLLDMYDSIEIGNTTNLFNKVIGSVELNKVNDYEKQKKREQSLIERFRDIASELIKDTNGSHVRVYDDRILFMDSPDEETAIEVLQINKNGIGFSQSGVDGPYSYAWTLDGKFNTDFIAAGTIMVNHLHSDVGASLDLSSNTSITLAVKDEVDDYLQNNPVDVKVEKPFYAYADIDGMVTAINRPDEVNYEPSNIPYSFDEDITSLIDEHGLDGWKLSYDVKANAETIEWLTVLTKAFSRYAFYQIQHPTTLNYEHYEQLITFKDESLSGKTTALGVRLYNTPFSIKNFMLKKIGNITNFSTSWTNQIYQGVYVGYDRPTDPNAYEWVKIQGDDGYTPYVQDGYWYINGVNTGQKAVGKDGEDGKDASILYRFSNDKTTMSLVDNSHRYVGLYRGTGDVNLASSYVWLDRLDLKVLEDRIKTNESNIAVNKTNIASKVSQTTYTADQTKVNEQLSTITQDMESWEAKFENIGGTNLLKGSKYLTEWQSVASASISETYNNVVAEWDTIMATSVVTGTGDKTNARKAVKRFIVPTDIAGRLVTFSMYVKSTRATATETVKVDGALIGTSEVINPGETKRIVIQGYANDLGYIDVYLVAQGVGYLFEGLVFKALLEIGNQVNDWTPHPDEIESGSTRITEEGLTVGKSNSDVQTSIMDNGLFIQDTISGEPIAEFTRDGANTSILTATDIYSDSIIRRQKNSMDIYVGSTMTGDGSGRDSSNRLDNINRAIDVGLNYAYHLTDYATINIYIKGTINEIVMITGVSGYGNINIIGESGSRLVGAIFVNSCTAQVNVRDLNISLDAPNAVNACINYHNSTSGNILNCTLVGQDTGRGVNVTRSYVAIENAQFFDLSSGIIATDFGRVLATDCKGRTTFKYGSATKGGWLGAIGTRPSVPELPALLSTDTGVIDDTKMTTYASGTRPSFAPPTFGSVTKTFYGNLSTANASNGNEWLEGEARQGTWDRKSYIGIARFGSQIKDWLAANGGYQGTVTAVVTAKRNRSSGGGTVSFKITNPATLTLPAVSRGGSSSATAGTSLTNSITTSSNLVLKTSTTSTSDYAGYTSVSIKITTMKKV